ncbi:hypothetical protein [Sphingomonas sp.]|uniref:hypothetical protein n=1 Tax=Sphingomonas sp. TaxID=28214 RepID=UPI00286D98A3|nr:hypothetical protein [Sphingomonas sp.]
MNKLLLAIPFALLAVATPAHATGGMICRTAGTRPIEISLGFGHVPGSPLILTRLREGERTVPVSAAQWWLDNRDLRVLLVDANAMKQEALLHARRTGHFYDGTLWRGGQRRWVRCREDG